jgi:ArsR family transcriptional regulator, arsenate/arsenite/antimonite-responsive transcriptional repressor
MSMYRIERNDPFRALVAAAKALSEPNRIRILSALEGRELCVCQIAELLDVTQSTLSCHLRVLKTAGLVEARRQGRWMHYTLVKGGAKRVTDEVLRAVRISLSDSHAARSDRARLSAILKRIPGASCATPAAARRKSPRK